MAQQTSDGSNNSNTPTSNKLDLEKITGKELLDNSHLVQRNDSAILVYDQPGTCCDYDLMGIAIKPKVKRVAGKTTCPPDSTNYYKDLYLKEKAKVDASKTMCGDKDYTGITGVNNGVVQ